MTRALMFGFAMGAAVFVVGMMAPRPVMIAVKPLISSYGSDVTIRCMVEPDESNRWIDLGVDGFSRSRIPLDSESRREQSRTVKEPPCGEQQAFCVLTQTMNRETRVNQPFQVACPAF